MASACRWRERERERESVRACLSVQVHVCVCVYLCFWRKIREVHTRKVGFVELHDRPRNRSATWSDLLSLSPSIHLMLRVKGKQKNKIQIQAKVSLNAQNTALLWLPRPEFSCLQVTPADQTSHKHTNKQTNKHTSCACAWSTTVRMCTWFIAHTLATAVISCLKARVPFVLLLLLSLSILVLGPTAISSTPVSIQVLKQVGCDMSSFIRDHFYFFFSTDGSGEVLPYVKCMRITYVGWALRTEKLVLNAQPGESTRERFCVAMAILASRSIVMLSLCLLLSLRSFACFQSMKPRVNIISNQSFSKALVLTATRLHHHNLWWEWEQEIPTTAKPKLNSTSKH